MKVVKVRNLIKKYGKNTVLKGVNYEIEKGEMGVIVGPDGAGKSTFLKIISGILEFDEGNVSVLGKDFKDYKNIENVREKIAFMPEGLGQNLYHTLTVEENLNFFAELYGIDKKLAEERKEILLKASGLYEFKNREAGKLSGGMMQKLGIICALIHMPELIILDEPTTGIDPLSRREMWELLMKMLVEENRTIIVSTTYLDEAEKGTFFSLFYDGKILRNMKPEELGERSVEDLFLDFLEKREEKFTFPFEVEDETPDPSIVVKNVYKYFGNFKALDNVSFEVRRGEIFGLLGPNGAGKTTLIKIMVGLYKPSKGEVIIAGERKPEKIKRKIGYMSQRFSLYKDLTVEENLLIRGGVYGIDFKKLKERIDIGLKSLKLENFRKNLVAELPLGIKQKVSLLSSILHLPPIVFLDEPTSGVDPFERKNFWKIIKYLSKEKGITVIVTTHHLDEAEYCDRVCLLNRGKVIALDTPQNLKEELRKTFGEPYELIPKDFSTAVEELKKRNILSIPYGRRIKIFLKENKAPLTNYFSLKKSKISMEDVFIGKLLPQEN